MPKHPTELLDVVNEDNEVIGQADRQEIHNKQWLHRAAHLLLTTEEGYFLLQQRADSRPTFPGRWDTSAAGHVKSGGTFDETILRETHEEIGYEPVDPAPVLLIDGSPETDFEWIQFYAERVTERPQLHADPLEVKDLRWWTEDELLESLVRHPESFTPALSIFFFLWKETGFFVPEKQKGNWYSIDQGNANQLHVRRAFLEAAEFHARVEDDQHWLAPQGGRVLFGPRRDARHTVLCVPRESLPEAIALLYLSRPAEDELLGEPRE